MIGDDTGFEKNDMVIRTATTSIDDAASPGCGASGPRRRRLVYPEDWA
jgi:hypothetical protein